MKMLTHSGTLIGMSVFFLGGCTERTDLTVSAAASLRDPLRGIGDIYEQAHIGTEVTFNFGSTGSLRRQIENGAPVDVLLSAAENHMENLIQSGNIQPDSVRHLLTNRLTVVTPRSSVSLSEIAGLARPEVRRIAIGEVHSVPVGQYAREALQALGLWNELRGKLVYAKDALQVLSYVETEQVEAGIVYASDAARSELVKTAFEIPARLHSPIRYSAGIVEGNRNKEEAVRFLEFLTRNEAKSIFKAHGFRVVEK